VLEGGYSLAAPSLTLAEQRAANKAKAGAGRNRDSGASDISTMFAQKTGDGGLVKRYGASSHSRCFCIQTAHYAC
jgi:hypothetical protein